LLVFTTVRFTNWESLLRLATESALNVVLLSWL